jgi:DNA (cytosine-5)-methyltransferase 1
LDDLRFLRSKERPPYEGDGPSVRVVDLFSGCGGLSLGVAEGARRIGLSTEVVLAVDIDQDAVDVFRLNFPKAHVVMGDVLDVFDGELGSDPTEHERAVAKRVRPVDILVSGAPCQGHSDLNNHTRRRDPRNALYLRAVRAVEVVRPSFVLLENVPAVQHDSGRVVHVATRTLESAGYRVTSKVVNLSQFGVPQARHRHILAAAHCGSADPGVELEFASPCPVHLPRSVRWAIGDLEVGLNTTGLDAPSRISLDNQKRIRWLFEHNAFDLPNHLRPECHHGDHSYRSMYGRLRWDSPAQTITSGFGSMGQGRYVHPSQKRTLTPHEAARLQTFPDFFDFDVLKFRGSWARMIGNAVPPLVVLQLATRFLHPPPQVMRHITGEEGTTSLNGSASQVPRGG